ncbi:MAG: hypothetical protein ACFB0A_14765 [Croceivirga sp.]
MKLTINRSLYIAGAILLGSVIISQFQQAELISSTVLVIISMALLIWGYQKDNGKLKCILQSKNKGKVTFVLGLLICLVCFASGRLIYLWSQV